MASTVRKARENVGQKPLPYLNPEFTFLRIDPRHRKGALREVEEIVVFARSLGVVIKIIGDSEQKIPSMRLGSYYCTGFDDIRRQLISRFYDQH